MSHELELAVARLQRQQGVLGAMLVGLDDGMIIAGDAGPGRDADTAAALAASLSCSPFLSWIANLQTGDTMVYECNHARFSPDKKMKNRAGDEMGEIQEE